MRNIDRNLVKTPSYWQLSQLQSCKLQEKNITFTIKTLVLHDFCSNICICKKKVVFLQRNLVK